MEKRINIFLFFIIIYNSLSAQVKVEDHHILDGLTGVERIDSLIQYADYLKKEDSIQTLNYANEAIDLASKLDDTIRIAKAYYLIGETYYYFDAYKHAILNYRRSLDLYKGIDDIEQIGECYNSVGLSYFYDGFHKLALENLYNALQVFESIDFKDEIAHVYSNIAMVHTELKDFDQTIKNYRLSATINQSIQDSSSLAVNYNGIGTTYFYQQQYDSAKVYYHQANKIFKSQKKYINVAITLNNIANIYVNEGDSLPAALGYYREAITVFEDLKHFRNQAYVMEGLGAVYRELGQYEKSIETFEKCIELCKEHKVGFQLLKLAYTDLAATYEAMNSYKKAYDAFQLYSQYSDSLLQEERLNQIAELREKHQTEKKEAEIERLNAVEQVHLIQIQRDKQIRFFGTVLLLLLIAFALFVTIGYFNKRKTNELLRQKNIKIDLQRRELEKLNASKNKFFSIIAHDLKNPFHTVMGYSYLMHKDYQRFKEEERKKYAADIYKSTNSIFRLLQNLLDWSRSQTGRLNYNPQAFDLDSLYENVYGVLKPVADSKNIKLVHSIAENCTVFADPMMVETIVRNLVNNAIKFSYEGGEVSTSILMKDNYVEICVKDEGVGIVEADLENLFRIDSKVKKKGTNEEDGSGLGLILCKEFTEKNNGTISATSTLGKGSSFCVTIPAYSES